MLGQFGVAELAGAVGGDLTGAALVGHDHELIAGLRYFGQTLNFYRDRRSSRLDGLAVLVQHGSNATKSRASQNHITCLECAGLNQHSCHWAATLVELGFNDQSLGQGVDWCAQLKNFCLQQYLFEQSVDAGTGARGHTHKGHVAAELFGYHFFCHQLAFDAVHIGVGLVDLVDCHHDRDTGRFRMLDSFAGLRHHAVISRNHQNHDVGGLRATGTHGRESLVTWRVQE